MKPDERCGERILELRTAQGLSQRALAGENVTYAYISRLEAGDRTPSWSALIELAERLETTALYLATGRTNGPCPVCRRA